MYDDAMMPCLSRGLPVHRVWTVGGGSPTSFAAEGLHIFARRYWRGGVLETAGRGRWSTPSRRVW